MHTHRPSAPLKRVPGRLALACCLSLPCLLAACAGDTEDPQFEADYVDDYESDQAEAAVQQAEVAALDDLDDLDDVPQDDAAAGEARPQSTRPPHGPLSLIEDDPHFSDPSGSALDDARALGADAVRVMVSWSSVVPGDPRSTARPAFNAASPQAYDWTAVDTRIGNALGRDLRVLVTLTSPMPYWASQEPAYCVRRQAEDEQKPPAERTFWSCGWKPDPREYARFVTAVGRHLREQGWAGKIWAFTLWNEPNISDFLIDGDIEPGPGAGPLLVRSSRYLASLLYRKLWFVARKALRKTAGVRARVLFGDQANDLINAGEDPGCPALCAASPGDASCKTCGNADGDPRSTRWAFLRYALCLDPGDGELLADRLLSRCPDAPRRVETAGLAFHPYAPRPEVASQSIGILQGLADSAAQVGRLPRDRGIYVTEFAYLTQKGSAGLGASRPATFAEQALYDDVTDHDTYDNRRVRSVAQYELYDEGRAGWESGLRFSDNPAPAAAYLAEIQRQYPAVNPATLLGAPKPAYDAYRLSIDVTRAGGGQVEVFGLARTGGDTVAIVEGKIGDTWAPVESLTLDALGYGKKTFPAGPSSAFRLFFPPYHSRETAPR